MSAFSRDALDSDFGRIAGSESLAIQDWPDADIWQRHISGRILDEMHLYVKVFSK